ncbi:MAG: FliM/FliN family flagellar motor switch protein [Candidatus Latescibacteria bacterium]|nr:FliM/FliN family flagellar motor switch protein [Candidatus Latescibacterota bacterium]
MAAKESAAKSGVQELAPLPEDALSSLDEVEVEVSVELGRHTLTLDQALHLGEHSHVELDKMVGEPVEVKLNGRLFARGEVVTVGEYFGVRLTEVLARQGG